MSQPEDREFYRDARDDYHNAMQKLTAGVFSKALKLDADGRPKAEQRATICELFETAVAAVPAAAEAAGRAPAPERQRLARQSPPTRADLLWGVTAATSESPAAGGDRGAAVSPPPREGGDAARRGALAGGPDAGSNLFRRALRTVCSSRLALWRPRSALRGCHQAKRCGASRSLGVVSSAAEPTTAVILTRGFCVLVGRSLLTHLFFLASAARVASLARAGVISHVPAPVSHLCTIAWRRLKSRARWCLITVS